MKTRIIRFFLHTCIIASCLLLFGTGSSHAQTGVLRADRHISIRDGLSDNRVKYIFQDSQGLIWLNTANGFQRFDGHRFLTLNFDTEENQTRLPSGIMNLGIAEDLQGNVWSVTEHEGPISYNRNTGKISQPKLDSLKRLGLRTHTVAISPTGQVFFTSLNGIIQLRQNRAVPVPLPASIATNPDFRNQRDMALLGDSSIWIASSAGFLRYLPNKKEWQYAGQNPEQHPLFNQSFSITSILADNGGRIWYSSWQQTARGRYLYRYHPELKQIDSVLLPAAPATGNDFFNLPESIVSDDANRILMATQGGQILEYDSLMQLQKTYDRIAIGDRDYQFESISRLFFDRDKNLWVACQDGLFLVGNNFGNRGNNLPLPAPEFPWQYHFGRLRNGPDNFVLYYSLGAPLLRWNRTTGEVNRQQQPYFAGKWKNYQTWLGRKKDRHYFTPWFSDEVVEYNIVTGSFRPILGPNRLGILSTRALPLKEGILFYGRSRILFCNDNGEAIDSISVSENMLALSDWFADENDKVWIIDQSGTVFSLTKTVHWQLQKIGPSQLRGDVYRIARFQKRLLIGTLYQGLVIADSNGQKIKALTHRDGLLSNTIDRLTIVNGIAFVETPIGINYLRQVEQPELLSSPILDKRHNDFLVASTDGSNGFYFLYRNRIEHVPELLLQKPDKLPFLFTSIRSSSRTLVPGEQAVLNWNDNQLAVEFAALDYVLAPSLQYRYRIGGEWIYLGNISQALLPRLQPGPYELQVQYRHPNGPWMEPMLSFSFRIRAAFWQQGWFYVLATLLALAPFFIYRWRKSREQRQIAKLRWQLARDLHDDVGSTLSSIGIYGTVLANRIKSDKELELLNEIRSKAGNTIQEMADIVWAIQPENDRLLSFLQRFRAFGVPLLESRGIQIDWVDFNAREEVHLTMLQRRNLYLICKEALNNSLKYSNARHFGFLCVLSDNRLKIELTDDGKGFDSKLILPGNGINNMQQRIAEINGTLTIISEPGSGCKIEIQVKL